MQSAKNKVIESLPNLIKTSKQKVQVVANWFSIIFAMSFDQKWTNQKKEISLSPIILINFQFIKLLFF